MTATERELPVRMVTPSFVGLLAAAMCFFFAYGMTIPILPPFVKDQLHGSDLVVGVVIGIMAVSSILIRPWVAARTLSWGSPRLVLLAGLVGAAAFAAYGIVGDTVQLSGLRLVTGAAQATLLVAAITKVTAEAPPDRRGEAISYFSVAPYLGIGLGPVLGEPLYQHFGFRWAFAVAGVIGLIGAVPILFVPNTRQPRPAVPVRRSIVHRAALWPGAVLALGTVGTVAMSAFMPLFVSDLGASGTQWIFLSYAAVVLLVRIVGGRIPDTMGPARTGWLSTGLICLGMIGFAVTPSVVGIYASLLPLGIGIALQYPGLLALTVNRVPEDERPQAVSTFTMFFDISTGLGGLFVGGVVAVGGTRSAFAACAACALLGLLFLRLFVLRPVTGTPVATAEE